MIAAVVVRLPMVSRPVAIPVLAKLVIKGTSSSSRLWLARRMAAGIAAALPGRAIHVVADAAYAGKELRRLPPGITWTTRLRKDAITDIIADLLPARRDRQCERVKKPPRNTFAVKKRGETPPATRATYTSTITKKELLPADLP